MRLATLLACLPLLAASVLAARIPKSPRTSILDSAQLKREIRRRQVTTADLKRRRNQPKRKRADPSALPPTCLLGANFLTNGDFESSASATDASPWVLRSEGEQTVLQVSNVDGYTSPGGSSKGLSFRAYEVSNLGVATQGGLKLCADINYEVLVDLGVGDEGMFTDTCQVTVNLVGETRQEEVYSGSPCDSLQEEEFCTDNGNGIQFRTVTSRVILFTEEEVAGDATFQLEYEVRCSSLGGSDQAGTGRVHVIDNATVRRTDRQEEQIS